MVKPNLELIRPKRYFFDTGSKKPSLEQVLAIEQFEDSYDLIDMQGKRATLTVQIKEMDMLWITPNSRLKSIDLGHNRQPYLFCGIQIEKYHGNWNILHLDLTHPETGVYMLLFDRPYNEKSYQRTARNDFSYRSTTTAREFHSYLARKFPELMLKGDEETFIHCDKAHIDIFEA